jgi:hypothetical protein
MPSGPTPWPACPRPCRPTVSGPTRPSCASPAQRTARERPRQPTCRTGWAAWSAPPTQPGRSPPASASMPGTSA